jgi:hypothetical protein
MNDTAKLQFNKEKLLALPLPGGLAVDLSRHQGAGPATARVGKRRENLFDVPAYERRRAGARHPRAIPRDDRRAGAQGSRHGEC